MLILVTIVLAVMFLGYVYTGVPFVPTPPHVTQAMISMVGKEWSGQHTVIDLGAGDGRVLEAIKRQHPDITAIGYELSPAVWLIGKLRSMLMRSGVQMRLGSMMKADLHDADVIVVYLFPKSMCEIEKMLDRSLRPGTIVLSHTFAFTGREPQITQRASRFGGMIGVYLYRWNTGTPHPSDQHDVIRKDNNER